MKKEGVDGVKMGFKGNNGTWFNLRRYEWNSAKILDECRNEIQNKLQRKD